MTGRKEDEKVDMEISIKLETTALLEDDCPQGIREGSKHAMHECG